jgi:hypothetical protein
MPDIRLGVFGNASVSAATGTSREKRADSTLAENYALSS